MSCKPETYDGGTRPIIWSWELELITAHKKAN